ncbi:DUF4275 family protein [Bacillus spongiae]|uniref:DUF4275 family protein n=1 Tax=Bacillus spongiae TaxID=2683610 RepID=A0ABU8HGG6_9BACI
MNLLDTLISKKIKTREIPKWGTYLRRQWENEFANHLSDEEKKSIHLYDEDGVCGYLWHIFSYEKKESLKNKSAELAFDRELKEFCYVFYQSTNDALIVENASSLRAIDLINEEDIYITNKTFDWTFVITHETGWCGPYFSIKSY